MENPEYNIRYVSQNHRTAIIKLKSSVLGGNDALDFTNALNELVNSGTSCIIIDTGDVQIMNSTGIGMLAHAHTNLTKGGYEMMLINVPDKIMKLLVMTHLDEVFIIHDNLESALSACSNDN
ncbi:MAG: STAS domain-containing protein [Candidatus Kapaibacterium sp.]|jgi:anti-sigma B factor antagonist|nr:STAS domain-containing protein [Candidatus Kapabacteria bacterium]